MDTYKKTPIWKMILIYVVIGGVVYGLVYYFVLAKKGGYNATSGQNSMYNSPTTTTPTTPVTTTPDNSNMPADTSPQTAMPSAPSTMAAQEFTVTGSEFAFSPSTITVKAGQPVKITFKNGGTYPHNLTITDLNVATNTIQPGEQDTITFTPTTAGSFGFKCTVGSHAANGMTGTLVVQ